MKIVFKKGYLEELYTTGKAKNKKYCFQNNVIKKYIKVINILRSVDRIEDLFVINSLNYEKLSGDKDEIESVRVDKQYRIEFITNEEGSLTICSIIELSNHYK